MNTFKIDLRENYKVSFKLYHGDDDLDDSLISTITLDLYKDGYNSSNHVQFGDSPIYCLDPIKLLEIRMKEIAYIYSPNEMISNIRNSLAQKFLINPNDITFYLDSSVEELCQNNNFNQSLDMELKTLLNSIKMISMIQMYNSFFLLKDIKTNSIINIKANPYQMVEYVHNILMCSMYTFIKERGMFNNDIDKIFERYNYNIESEECAAELSYYLSGRYFKKINIQRQDEYIQDE